MSTDSKALSLWPKNIRRQLMALSITEGDYAVFDADNTLWAGDITEALTMRLESQGVLNLKSLNKRLIEVAPKPNETIMDRYEQICQEDVEKGYVWIVKILYGLALGTVIEEINAMMQTRDPLPQQGLYVKRTPPNPKPLKAQRQLITWLRSKGVDVWVVSASPECLVQAIACHPIWGFGFHRSRVIGVNMSMIQENGLPWTPAENRKIDHGDSLFSMAEKKSTYSMQVMNPITCFEGKALAIDKWISSKRPPILAAGDSANDIAMMKKCSQLALHISKSIRDDKQIDEALKAADCLEKRVRIEQALLKPESPLKVY